MPYIQGNIKSILLTIQGGNLMKKLLSFTLVLLMCFIALTGCSSEEKELTFHDLLKSEFFGISKCFKQNSVLDVVKEIDSEAVEKHLSNIAELSNNTSYTEEERKTAYVFYCFYKEMYKLKKAGCEIGYAPQNFQSNFITVEQIMIRYITSSKNTIPDEVVKMAINLEKMCDEYLARKGINVVE